MGKFILIAPLVGLTLTTVYLMFFKSPPPLPHFDVDDFWGPASQAGKKQDTSIRPFKIQFDDSMIKDLRDRLKNRRKLTPPLEGIGFQYGFNTAQLDSWVGYWANKYDFKAREAAFNKYPQFKTNIQGLDIHFLKIKPKNTKKEVVPLLMLHGWPGSVREFFDVVPLLTADSPDRDFVLELIIPSLPGYGFSDPAAKPGLGAPQIAVILRNLMHRLGHKKFYVQGGDWGSVICSNMATIFPNELLGYHSNMAFLMSPSATFLGILSSFFPSLILESKYQDRMYPLTRKWAFLVEESGYFHIQATKPDTIGAVVNESPTALLTYILEKFSTYVDKEYRSLPDGGLTKKFTRDQLLDNLMVYWVTNSITTSMRLYAESFSLRNLGYSLDSIPTPVPTWVLQAKNELFYQPKSLLKIKFPNLVEVPHLEEGGHFLAFELPNEFSKDVLEAMTQFRKLNRHQKSEL